MAKIKLNANGLSADTLISHVQRNVESASRLLLGELSEARERCLAGKEAQRVKLTVNEIYYKATFRTMQQVPRPEVKSVTEKEGYSVHFGVIGKDIDDQQHTAIRITSDKVKTFNIYRLRINY